jgi:hypothetical protein
MRLTVLFLMFAIGLALAQPQLPASDEPILKNNPTYSAEVVKHGSPEALLASREAELAATDSETAAGNSFGRFLHLPGVAQAALEAGQNEKAENYAREALQLVETFRRPVTILPDGSRVSRDGAAVFQANLVLGRLALLEGDVEAAKQYLLLAGKTGGSPVLDTFGPNMSLARELLKVSEPETVLAFLDECRAFWKMEDGRLDRWSAQIRAGELPAFGPNLIYN